MTLNANGSYQLLAISAAFLHQSHFFLNMLCIDMSSQLVARLAIYVLNAYIISFDSGQIAGRQYRGSNFREYNYYYSRHVPTPSIHHLKVHFAIPQPVKEKQPTFGSVAKALNPCSNPLSFKQ